MNISIRKLLLINTIIIILSMILIYHLTPEGYEGGISGKKYGNITFLTLVVLNLLYSFYYVIRINHTPKKMLFLFLNLGAILLYISFVLYFIAFLK